MMEMAYFRSKSYFSSSLSRINNLLKHIRERVLLPVFSWFHLVMKNQQRIEFYETMWNRSNIYM